MDSQYYTKVVKQGNSLCVRIPLNISKNFNIKERTNIAVTLTNVDEELRKLPESLVNAYKSVMKKFSVEEIREFLNYYAIEKTTSESIKINSKYKDFKKLLKNREIKDSIKKKMEQTAYWKRLGNKYKK